MKRKIKIFLLENYYIEIKTVNRNAVVIDKATLLPHSDFFHAMQTRGAGFRVNRSKTAISIHVDLLRIRSSLSF